MYRLLPAFLVAFCGLQAVEAQPTIQWRTDVPAAVQTAKQKRLPLMYYVLGRTEKRDNEIENAQRRTFSDPKVLQVSRRFVTVHLSRSANRDVLEQLKLPTMMTEEIVFATPFGPSPYGEVLDHLAPSGATDPNAFVEKMKLVFDAYRQQLFAKEIQPMLDRPDASPEDMHTALQTIHDLNIVSADSALIKLVEREKLDKKVLFEAYDVLAALSTKPGIEKLVELANTSQPRADQALGKATPVGAEIMADKLVEEDGTVRVPIYDAICKICGITERKSAKWWDRAENRLKVEEIDKTKATAKAAAERYRAQNDE